MNKSQGYWKQIASRWVSAFVLLGCLAITGVLVYSAMKAQVLGNKLTSQTSQLEE